MEKVADFLEKILPDEDSRSVILCLVAIVLVVTFAVTSGVIVTSISTDVRCMVSPETCTDHPISNKNK